MGVSYGHFDHQKLIESLRILPSHAEGGSKEPALGVEEGGLHSAVALLLARYFMYEQVYFHKVRRIYDHHLIEFMVQYYGSDGYQFDVDFHLSQTDNEVLAAMRAARKDPSAPGHKAAVAILGRGHFKCIYSRNPTDDGLIEASLSNGKVAPSADQANLSASYFLYEALKKQFPNDEIFFDSYSQSSNPSEFPVLMPDGRIENSVNLSDILRNIPLTNIGNVYTSGGIAEEAASWLERNREAVLKGGPE